MRFLVMILIGLSFFSCKEQMNAKTDYKDILDNGNWKLIKSDKPFKRFQTGLNFSEDNQVFDVDSQGQIVTPMHERIYGVSGDTLKIVDYRFEQRFLFSRGTSVFLIEEISDDKLVLNVIHPDGPNKMIFENLK